MNLGDFVRLVVPADRDTDCFSRGRITAIENYTDFHCTRTWLYVTWFDGDGRPEKEQQKHHASELQSA